MTIILSYTKRGELGPKFIRWTGEFDKLARVLNGFRVDGTQYTLKRPGR